MRIDFPPDDLTLEVKRWLRDEVYPGLLGQSYDDLADAVWCSGSNGFIGRWVRGDHAGEPPRERMENIKHELFAAIEREAFGQPVPTGKPLKGQLRIGARGFADDTGPVLPVFCHFGEAFSAFVHRPVDVEAQLAEIAKAGYHGIRFWDVLGFYDGAWRGKEVTPIPFVNKSGQAVPATQAYYERLGEFLRLCDLMGLKVHHSRGDLNSWTYTQKMTHCQIVGEVQRQVPGVVALNESCNEAWQNGCPEVDVLIDMAGHLGNHALRALSCPPDATEERDDLNEYCQSPADVFYVHGFRQNKSHDRIRHIFSIAYEGKPDKTYGWQGEPAGPGPGVTVGQENHPEALAMMATVSLMAKQAWVYMSSPGVFWDSPIQNQPGFREVARIKDSLPSWLMAREVQLFHGGTTWQGKRALVANAEGNLRCDHALSTDGQVVIAIYGDPGTWRIPVERQLDGVIINPLTGEEEPVRLLPGQTLNLTFERGRIFKGFVS